MTCCGGKKCGETEAQIDEMKVGALSFGFNIDWVTQIMDTYGPEILNLVLEASRNGISKDFIMEVLGRFGPILLGLLVDLLQQRKMKFAAMDGAVIDGTMVGEEVGFMMLLLERFLPQLVEKYLPMLMETYGDKIVQMLMELILNSVKK
jgi:hypothetical protein